MTRFFGVEVEETVDGFGLMDVQLLATSEERGGGRGWRERTGGEEGGQADKQPLLPSPLICAWVIRNTWLPIMAPVLSCEVEQGCEGHVHTSTHSHSDGKHTANTSLHMPLHSARIQLIRPGIHIQATATSLSQALIKVFLTK